MSCVLGVKLILLWPTCCLFLYHLWLLRCPAGGVWGANPLVFHCLLRTQQPCGRSLPGYINKCAGGWFYWPFKQQEPFLSWTSIQCQPQLDNREHTETYWQRYSQHTAGWKASLLHCCQWLCFSCPNRPFSVYQGCICTM